MTMITPSYLGETIEYSSLHACRSTLEDPTARRRLEPVAEKLGSGEGARVLGLSRIRLGATDESVACLSSYYEARTAAFDRATQGLRATIDASWRRAELDPSLAKRYRDAHDDGEKKRAHDEAVAEIVRADPEVRSARLAVRGVAPLVEVALALAQVEIARARGKERGERQSRLERATHYLDSVGEFAGVGLDQWWVWQTRVRVELGRTADAENVLDHFVDIRGHSFGALLAAAELLAEAGDFEVARGRAEEAFATAKLPENREIAAQLRARIPTSREDQLAWLERAGKQPAVAALEKQARASLALEEGRFEEAAAAFDEAARLDFGVGGPSAASFHVALLALLKSQATGRAADLDAAIAGLEKLTSDDAAPLAALDALADALQERAVATVLGDRLRTDVLHDRGLDLLDLSAVDENEARTLATSLAANADMKRSLEVRERSIAEAPTRPRPYSALLAFVTKLRDPGALDAFAARVDKAGLDRLEDQRELVAYWSGSDAEARGRRLAARRKRADAVLALARTVGHTRTIAVALASRAALEVAGTPLPADHELAVRLDELAVALSPTFVTRLSLRNALLSRAAEHARAGSPQLAKLLEERARFGSVTVLGWAVRSDATLAAKVASDSDGKRALELHSRAIAGEVEAMPHDWLIFRVTGDDRAAEAGKRVAASRLAFAEAKAACAVMPTDPDRVNDLATVLELRGEKDARAKLLAEAKKAGVLLPYEVLEGGP